MLSLILIWVIIFTVPTTILFEKYVVFGSQISGAYKINRIINENHAEEIPFLGSSRAQGTIVPSEIDKNIFNYGIDGIQDNVILMMLQAELQKDKSTPILINFDLDGVNNSIGDISNYLPVIGESHVYELVKDELSVYQRIPFVKYYGEFEHFTKLYLNDRINLTKITDQGGSFETEYNPASLKEDVKKRLSKTIEIKNDQGLIQMYHKLIKSTQRRIVFVVVPLHSSYFSSVKNIEAARSFLFGVSKKYNHVEVLDMSELSYPDSLFFNTTHVNYNGAVEFSAALKDSLIKLQVIDGE